METQKGLYGRITAAVSKLRSDPFFGPRLSNKWLPTETWIAALKMSCFLDGRLVVDKKLFNKAMTCAKCEWRDLMTSFDGLNHTGFFRCEFSHQKYYYSTEKLKQVKSPYPVNDKWKADVDAAIKDILSVPPSTRSRPAAAAELEKGGEDSHADEAETEASNKRQKAGNPIPIIPASAQLRQITYWQSTDAMQLFCPGKTADCDVKDTLQQRVKRLQSANQTEHGWRNVVDDPDDLCSQHNIFKLRQRSALLCSAYLLALEHMNQWTWHECCKEACSKLNQVGLTQTTSHQTLAQWNMAFRQLERFPNPQLQFRSGKVKGNDDAAVSSSQSEPAANNTVGLM